MIDKKFLKYRSYEIGTVIDNVALQKNALGILTGAKSPVFDFTPARASQMLQTKQPKLDDTLIEMWIPMDYVSAYQTGIAYMLNDDFGIYAENKKELLQFQRYLGKRFQTQVKKEMEIVKQIFNGTINPDEQNILRVIDDNKSLFTLKSIPMAELNSIYAINNAFVKYKGWHK